MGQYIVRRCLHAVLVVFGVVTAVFILMNLSGDPVVLMMPDDASESDLQAMRERLGLDRPLYIQYVSFVGDALRGDFQNSLRYQHSSAMDVVLSRYPRTILLALAALIVSVAVSTIFGIISAVTRGSLLDRVVMSAALFGQATPNFWLGIMLILLFAVTLGWLPSQGYQPAIAYLILPTVTLATAGMARLTRLTRSGMLEVLNQDYVRTARAKGLSERIVLFRHAFKNTAIPLVTVIGLDFGALLGGAIITEQIFQWGGVGQLLVTSINSRDFPVVQAAVFIIAVSFVFINLVVDVLYTWLDPRVRLT